MKILLLNGPNLNLTGFRETEIYGNETLLEIIGEVRRYVESRESQLDDYQTNHEGDIIDALHSSIGVYDGIILNAGAYTHYSYAIRDAIAACGIPTVEVHMSDIFNREAFRAVSVIQPVCIAQISGKGKQGYIEAAELLINRIMH